MKTLLLLVLVACGSGSSGEPIDASKSSGDGCSFALTEQVAEPPPAPLLDLVRACETDAGQCAPLCKKVFDDLGHANDFIDTCMVEHSATTHTVKIAYHLLCAD